MIGLGAATIIGAAIAGVSALASSVGSYFSNKEANKINKDYANKNIDIQQQQLNYQKYLNNNQIQIQASDAQKAGINPIAMQGGSLSSGSYSNVNADQQGVNYDTGFASSILGLVGSIASDKNQKDIASASNATTKEVNKDTLDAYSGNRDAEKEKINAETKQIEQRTAHEKDMNEQELEQQKVQTEILRRKNQGQINTGTFDGQLSVTYSDTGSVKFGPISGRKSTSSTVPYGSNLANSSNKNLDGFNNWLVNNIPNGATPVKDTPFYYADDKHIGERLFDNGYRQVGKYDRYVVFYNRSINKYAVVDNGGH